MSYLLFLPGLSKTMIIIIIIIICSCVVIIVIMVFIYRHRCGLRNHYNHAIGHTSNVFGSVSNDNELELTTSNALFDEDSTCETIFELNTAHNRVKPQYKTD